MNIYMQLTAWLIAVLIATYFLRFAYLDITSYIDEIRRERKQEVWRLTRVSDGLVITVTIKEQCSENRISFYQDGYMWERME